MPPCGIFVLQHNSAMCFLNYLEALGLKIVCFSLLSLVHKFSSCSAVFYGMAKQVKIVSNVLVLVGW